MQDFRETASRSSSQHFFGVSIRVTLLLRTEFSSLSVETTLGGAAGVMMGKK
jgi:hypothetical protein